MSSVLYARRAADPLNSSNTIAASPVKGGAFTTATYSYPEDALSQQQRQQQQQQQPPPSDLDPTTASMAAYAAAPSPPGLWVRAMYDYDADDRTSLSFRQGDLIQVITQLESGWWDGIIHNNVRGWFPSNYCEMISGPDDLDVHERNPSLGQESDASGPESEYEEDIGGISLGYERRPTNPGNGGGRPGASSLPEQHVEHGEEAAFWIPQATADGHLYYYNTLTGVATTELPLEPPTSDDETGPRDRLNVVAPDQTRGPRNLYDHDEDDASASEIDESFHNNRKPRRRRSMISDGVSGHTSMEDLNGGNGYLSRNQSTDFHRPERSTSMGNALMATSYIAELPARSPTHAQQCYYDDAATPPPTWSRLVENMERAVAAYRNAVNNAERSEYVRRAEDISDHLRMLLAAGSGTTDNHSGTPSIISTNKALYPHFRDMMSKFSKLVLSSHIAAADWPAPDSYSKCLQEAEGVLNGVYGYVEVARQQKGEDLPRLRPGFILGAYAGGSWRAFEDPTQHANGPLSPTFAEADDEPHDAVKLDDQALERLEELRTGIEAGMKQLNSCIQVKEKLVTSALHEQVGNAVCLAAAGIVESFKSFISSVEELDIKDIRAQETQVATFLTQKQLLYDLIANLIVTCQTVAGPLGDEWADVRGDSFEARLQAVKQVSKQLDTGLNQITSTLHGILELSASDSPRRQTLHGVNGRLRSGSRTYPEDPSDFQVGGGSNAGVGGLNPARQTRRDTTKIQKFFGEVPAPLLHQQAEDAPSYLRLDYEGEIVYDNKTTPPQIKGGTLTALVEQLTRHDRMEPSFNHTFLLTYRSFTTAQELFEMLVKRFSIQPPQGISAQEHQAWAEKKQKLVRFRVVNVLKTWIDMYWLESNDEPSNDLLRRVLTFATDHVASTNTGGAGPLRVSIETRLRGDVAVNNKRMVLNLNTQAPAPIVPKNLKKIKFLDIDPLEFARQLTILESKLYGKVKPYECLNKTWQKKVVPGGPDPAPNVKALIAQSNQLTNWVAEMILNQSDVRKRVAVIKHFVTVAEKCRTLNNFSALTAIITALSTASIHRLKRTWDQVNQKTLNMLEGQRELMVSTKNFVVYREALHSANPPCIPFFGVYLTDLIFIEDGIPSVIKKTNLINFVKRTKTADVIRDIQQYQNVPYPLQPVPDLQNYITDSMKAASDVHEMYERSLQIEPREREDEKIAR